VDSAGRTGGALVVSGGAGVDVGLVVPVGADVVGGAVVEVPGVGLVETTPVLETAGTGDVWSPRPLAHTVAPTTPSVTAAAPATASHGRDLGWRSIAASSGSSRFQSRSVSTS
jgi:hypothetical protein